MWIGKQSRFYERIFTACLKQFLTCDNEYKFIVSNVCDIASLPPQKKKKATHRLNANPGDFSKTKAISATVFYVKFPTKPNVH